MMRCAWVSGCVVLLCGVSVRAQPETPEVQRPASAGRLVGRFDFEERRSNPYPVPRYWKRHQEDPDPADPSRRVPRDGFPTWNQAYLDYSFAYEGEGSLCLPTGGGSTAIRLDSGVLPVFPDADYLVSAKVRTHQVTASRARMSAWFLDRANRPIEGSRAEGELIRAEDSWVGTVLVLPGAWPEAAYIQIELELLQPERYEHATLGPHQVWARDISGAAWFDDLSIAQLPRVAITTDVPGNVSVAPSRPTLRRLVRDMTGEAITARVCVYDADGVVAATDERGVVPGEGWWSWQPRLERYGWYRASLDVMSGPRRVGSTYVDFVWLPPEAVGAGSRLVGRDRGRFGVIVDELPDAVRAVLPDLVRGSGAGTVTLPLWADDLTPAGVPGRIARLVPLVSRLIDDGRVVSFGLPRVPSVLAAQARVAADDPLTLFAQDERVWGPLLLPFLDKFGQSVQGWRIGRDRVDVPGVRADVGANVSRLEQELARLVPGPKLILPWPTELGLQPGALGPVGPGVVSFSTPYAMPPASMPELAAAWYRFAPSVSGRVGVSAVFQTLPTDRYSRRDAAADLIRRAVEFAGAFDAGSGSGDPPGLAIVEPWTISGVRSPQVMPSASLAAWRTLSDRMRDRRVVGLFPVAPGVRCFILAPAPGAPPETAGALVAWREESVGESSAIDAYLGEGTVTSIDLFGNARRVEQRSEGTGLSGTAPHHLPITDDPVFIEGVDVELAQFAASFRLEPGFAPSTHEEHEHVLLLRNPWPHAVEGRLVVVEPGGYSDREGQRDRSWRISPRVTRFAVGPGDTVKLPVTIAFSPVEEAGVKDFIAEVELETGREQGRLRMRAPLEIGLESIRLDLTYRFGPTPDGPDLIVEAIIGNNSTSPVTFEVGAFPPPDSGLSRSRASVSNLAPGDTAVRRFGFPGAASVLRGRKVAVGVNDVSTRARINRSITIE